MTSISFDKPIQAVGSSSDDIKRSILEKLSLKGKQKSDEQSKQEEKQSTESEQTLPKKSSRRKPKRSVKDAPERLNRTLFVGNVPSKCCTDKQLQRELKAIFTKYGPVESLRFRSLVLSEAMPRKHAFISGQLSDKSDSNNAYVVMKRVEDAQNCLVENTTLFHNHHLRVDIAGTQSKIPSHKKSVFVGNIPLDISEETLWKAFADCGAITSVRVIRDKSTGKGKGFAYIAFKDRETVKMGLLLDGTEIGGRKIRVQKCSKPGEEPKSRTKSEIKQHGNGYKKSQGQSKGAFKKPFKGDGSKKSRKPISK
jgi:nucleolar protein 12